MADIMAFKVDILPIRVERLQRKLHDTRLLGRPILPDAGMDYGPSYEWASDPLEAWKYDFDWSTAQGVMNEYPHYLALVENMRIHFLHARARQPDAIPLLMVLDWPGSLWEFRQVWGPLSNPEDANAQAFHVVISSLPGFCWSDWPLHSGWTLQDTAGVFDILMKRLGYKEYMVQSGDWRHSVGRELGSRYTESCKLLHCNFSPGSLPEGVECTDREQVVTSRVDDWTKNHLGYAVCMRTRPHTIGLALHDNPMGILMCLGEKYNEAADPEKQKRLFWTKAILTTTSLYYFTGCIMPSILTYDENVPHEQFASFTTSPENKIKVPYGYTSFFWDTEPSSKRVVGRRGNLVYYKERDDGWHFAALKHPEGLMEDSRELVAQE